MLVDVEIDEAQEVSKINRTANHGVATERRYRTDSRGANAIRMDLLGAMSDWLYG